LADSADSVVDSLQADSVVVVQAAVLQVDSVEAVEEEDNLHYSYFIMQTDNENIYNDYSCMYGFCPPVM
jgi:hypothetical protein